MSVQRAPNRLYGEASPYLLQHAHNPVDWYPWGPEALGRARLEDRPILLSIGYAACHWCHVMEHESFEDDETAALMNDSFVCIKVDREERPDLDAIYMDAVQSMTGRGGWPMTVFLTPAEQPFFAGTYFPSQPRHGMPAFRDVLRGVAAAWRDQRERVDQQGRRVAEEIGRTSTMRESREPLSEEVLRGAHAGLRQAFDARWGGFGGAPKFPQPMTLEFLLRCHLRGYEGSLEMVTTSLDRMAAGGIHDHVGGGFHRYAVDERWHVPHFEKMLYDNAQLARLYLHAWQVTGEVRYRLVAEQTLEYLLEEMCHPEGGFFSSQDADSEGVEGRFFVWSWDELVSLALEVVGRRELAEALARWLGATKEGNWEGTNVLWTPLPMERVAADAGLPSGALATAWSKVRPTLRRARGSRVRPSTDDKVLAAWNGLAIAAFAETGAALDEPRYVEAAGRALRFLHANLLDDRGRIRRSWREGRASGPAYLDDYALLGLGALAAYQATFEPWIFPQLRSLAADLVRLFADREGGGFFQTGSDAEELLIRPKELFDNAVPSGNSAAAELLLRMSLLTGEPEEERTAVSALRVVRDLMERAPTALGHALCALDIYLGTATEVAVVGDTRAEDARRLLRVVYERFLPNLVLAAGRPEDGEGEQTVPLLRGRSQLEGMATAYVCRRFVCRQPVTAPEDLAAQLQG